MDLVVVNPGMVVGPILPPALNLSMQLMVRTLEGTHFQLVGQQF